MGALAATAPTVAVPLALSDSPTSQALSQILLNLVGQAAGIEWQIQSVPFARSVLLAETGQALAYGLSRNAERERTLEFSEPIYRQQAWMIVRKNHGLVYRSLADLQGRSICMGRSVSFGDEFDAAKGKLFRVESVGGGPVARVRMLMAERCDVALTTHRSKTPGPVDRALRKAIGEELAFEVLPKPMLEEGVHFAVQRGHPLAQWLPRINAAMAQQRKAIVDWVASDL
ncbi:ABC transporter substrate-binding protein [Paucibacter sp. AS339]|uniref:substrate-binding periplasmic protein n=1 Tax=Paucibacter hankyongi TaxID=3133434 RepID=UPI0030AD4379